MWTALFQIEYQILWILNENRHLILHLCKLLLCSDIMKREKKYKSIILGKMHDWRELFKKCSSAAPHDFLTACNQNSITKIFWERKKLQWRNIRKYLILFIWERLKDTILWSINLNFFQLFKISRFIHKLRKVVYF